MTIDAIGCQVAIADKIVEHQADYLLALKGNQPTLETEVADYFGSAPAEELVSKTTVEKAHGRIETRTYTASSNVDWIVSARSYPGEPRFTTIKTVVKIDLRTEYPDRSSFDTRLYVSSAPLDIERLANGVRAKNMAIVRRFALGLVRANKTKRSVKTRRKSAGWNPNYLLELLQLK